LLFFHFTGEKEVAQKYWRVTVRGSGVLDTGL
jgi:hypothetical protein